MRELTISELEVVSGGIYDADVVAAVGAVAGGTGIGFPPKVSKKAMKF